MARTGPAGEAGSPGVLSRATWQKQGWHGEWPFSVAASFWPAGASADSSKGRGQTQCALYTEAKGDYIDEMSANTLVLEAAGRSWRLERPGNLEAMWEAMDEEGFREDDIPYWVEVWPAALALAAWLEQAKGDLASQPCLDLGCGLGLTALAGQWLGAKVLAVDLHFQAARYCLHNARLNGVALTGVLAMNWNSPAIRPALFAHVWGADIIYERRFFQPVLAFLDYALKAGGEAWLAEPCRSIFREFVEVARTGGWVAKVVQKDEKQGCAVWSLQRA